MTQSSSQEPEAMVIPGSSSAKGQETGWSENTTPGVHVNLLQPGGTSVRLPTDSVQSSNPLGPCPVGHTNNPREVGGNGYYTRMVERGSHGIPLRAPGMDAGFNGTIKSLSTNAATQCMAENARYGASVHVRRQVFTRHYENHIRMGGTYGGIPGVHAFANIQALFSRGGGNPGMSSSRAAAPGMNLQYNPGISPHTPTPYPQRTQLNSSIIDSVPALSSGSTAGNHPISSVGDQKFGSTSEPVTLALGDGHRGNDSRPQLLDRQIDSAGIVDRSQSNMCASSLKMADDGFVMPQSPSTPTGLQQISTVPKDAQQEHLREELRLDAMERGMENTPARRPRGRQLAQTAAAQPPPGDVIVGGVHIGDQRVANRLAFDLNEMPGHAEATPKRRKKYHPIVAKDKRTYKKRKVNGNHQASHSKKPGLNVEHDTAICDCEACIKMRLERRGRKPGDEANRGNADAVAFTSKAKEMAISQSPDARNTAGAGEALSFAHSPVSPLESYNRSCLGSPPSSSKSPTGWIWDTLHGLNTSPLEKNSQTYRTIWMKREKPRFNSISSSGASNPTSDSTEGIAILTPKTNDEMQQLAQMELLGDEFPQPQLQNAPEMCYPTKAAKKPSKKELARNPNATTLWPDLMQEQSNPKPAKERRGRKANNVENHRQEGQSSNSNMEMAIVEFENKAMVPYTGQFNLLRKNKPRPKVVLDTETIRVWKLLMQGAPDPGSGAENDLMWEVERRKMEERAFLFIDRMHIVQGDRAFSPWKGTVVDAIVGAFLTQNVNDVLSSSAFMAMRSHFRNDFEPHLQKLQKPQGPQSATEEEMRLPIETSRAAEQSQTAAKMKTSVSLLGFQGTANGAAGAPGESTEAAEAENVKGKEKAKEKAKQKTGLTGLG